MSCLVRPVSAGILCLPSWVWAAAPAASAAPQTSTFSMLFQALLALVVVLAALFAFLWLLRRFAPNQAGTQGVVRVVGGVMLGTRERLVVVEVADQWLLIGVAAGNVSHLHTMPKPAGYIPTSDSGLPGSFAGKLADILSRRKDG